MDNPQFKLTKSNLPTVSSLTLSTLQRLSDLYPRVLLAAPQQKRHKVSPTELSRLDTLRYATVPATVSTRQTKKGGSIGGFLAKAELQDVVEWKLARGVYRPTLPSLIASNSEESVIDTTKNAFQQYTANTAGKIVDNARITLNKLCDLKGVGPATASLLLSVAHPTEIPFFSDELFYWTARTSEGVKLEKIKYNMKEYLQLVQVVNDIQARLSAEGAKGRTGGVKPRADDIERAAFVVQKLQNPDIYEAVLGKDADDADAILRDAKAKDEHEGAEEDFKHKQRSSVAELDEAAPPTDERTDLTEKEKDEEIEEKKEILEEHGAKIKSTGKKRSRAADDQLPPRRSTRTKR